ncbi:MAG: DUF5131 family protein [Smithella sp.]
MSLTKSKGNMYPWVTHTHCHLGGQCPHECSYCYVDHFPYGRPAKYKGELRLIEKEFSEKYGEGNTIFIENCNDLFADEVHRLFIKRIMAHCCLYPNNTYVFQTKNPYRYMEYQQEEWMFPDKIILGCTIESNKNHGISKAPEPEERLFQLNRLKGFAPIFVTIEPILDFDVDVLSSWIDQIRPEFVNIGADSKKHNLPEPSADKINALIAEIQKAGIEIREKHNLERLLK